MKINPSDSIASKPLGCPASAILLLARERGFFGSHFSSAAGELNNTKSVGLALDTYLSSEVYRFLKRAVPIKRVDFAVDALDNDLVNHRISFRPHYAGFVTPMNCARQSKSCGNY
jgi:hypothetical protein